MTPADVAAFEALKETCRAQSLRLDAAREQITELESTVAAKDAEIAAKDKTISEQRALLAQHRLDTADEATEPTEAAE